jgi:hypothetical protein
LFANYKNKKRFKQGFRVQEQIYGELDSIRAENPMDSTVHISYGK